MSDQEKMLERQIRINGSIIFLIIIFPLLAGLVVAYFIVEQEIIKLSIISLIVLLLVIALTIIYRHFLSLSCRLKRKLEQIPSLTQGESIERLKDFYTGIYQLYSRLSEHSKQNFYARILEIRERIERKMKADKKMELLVQNIGRGSLQQQNKNYQQMYEIYKRLPEVVKRKYYPHLAHAKSLLEKGNI